MNELTSASGCSINVCKKVFPDSRKNIQKLVDMLHLLANNNVYSENIMDLSMLKENKQEIK